MTRAHLEQLACSYCEERGWDYADLTRGQREQVQTIVAQPEWEG